MQVLRVEVSPSCYQRMESAATMLGISEDNDWQEKTVNQVLGLYGHTISLLNRYSFRGRILVCAKTEEKTKTIQPCILLGCTKYQKGDKQVRLITEMPVRNKQIITLPFTNRGYERTCRLQHKTRADSLEHLLVNATIYAEPIFRYCWEQQQENHNVTFQLQLRKESGKMYKENLLFSFT